MQPAHIIRVGIEGSTVHVPIFRLPYFAGRDGFAAPGGFFEEKTGEVGVMVDQHLSDDDLKLVANQQIEANMGRLVELVRRVGPRSLTLS